jgi:hypothetical protein
MKIKGSKRKSKPSKKSQTLTNILDFTNSRDYYGVVVKGKLQPDADNPYLYKLDEIDDLRVDYPRAKVVKIRLTYHVIAEVTL